MEAAQGKRVGGERVSLGRLLLVGPLAAIAAAAANAVVYFVAVALGATPQGFVIEGGGGSLGLQQVIFASVIGAVGATAMFATVALLARWRRPILAFRIVAAVVLALFVNTAHYPRCADLD